MANVKDNGSYHPQEVVSSRADMKLDKTGSGAILALMTSLAVLIQLSICEETSWLLPAECDMANRPNTN